MNTTYFDRDFNYFFKALAANNHKDWFDQNRKIYEKKVKEPFYSLVSDLINEMKEDDWNISVKDCVFRINRDIRFSKDKTPYKLHVSAAISKGGKKKREFPALFFHLSPGESFIGGGIYRPEKNHLYTLRTAIAHNDEIIEKCLNHKPFKKLYPKGFEPTEQNKILPKELKEAGKDIPFLLNKNFYYMKYYEGEAFPIQKNLKEVILNHHKASEPINDFFYEALGL